MADKRASLAAKRSGTVEKRASTVEKPSDKRLVGSAENKGGAADKRPVASAEKRASVVPDKANSEKTAGDKRASVAADKRENVAEKGADKPRMSIVNEALGEEGGGGAEDGGPGLLHQPFVLMEELLQKLKLLEYEFGFCKQFNFKSFSRHYFALATNPGEQFHSFTCVCAWLLKRCGRLFEMPQEYDDPNAMIAGILEQLRQLGHSPDFPPNKLKVGYGEQCLWVLDKLANEAIKVTNFTFSRPNYPSEDADDDVVLEEEAELTLDKPVHAAEEEEVEDDDHVLGLDDLKRLGMKTAQVTDFGQGGVKQEEIMESTVDAADWKLEVERVLPQLKVTVRNDNKDWHIHVEQMHQNSEAIETSLKVANTQLNKLHDEIQKTMEKIGSRERYINNQLESMVSEFRKQQEKLSESKDKYRQCSGGVAEKSRKLAEITEEVEKIKQEMEERGSSMTDGAPLVKAKQALVKLRGEITQMDIRIGVVQHILLQAKLKERHEQNRAIGGAANVNVDFVGFAI